MSLARPVLPVAALRRLAGRDRGATAVPVTSGHGPCALCGAEILLPAHAHAADTEARTLGCLCRGCELVLPAPDSGAVAARWQRIPTGVWWTRVPAAVVDALDLPVGLAFLLLRAAEPPAPGAAGTPGVLVGYPGAAGVVESAIPFARWRAFCAAVPLAASVRPDVEALLLHQPGPGAAAPHHGDVDAVIALRVGVDRVYGLAGDIRAAARGGPHEIARLIAERIAALQEQGCRWAAA